MGDSKILEEFFKEQHNKWKKNVLQPVSEGNIFHSEHSQLLKQKSLSEPVASNPPQAAKKN